MVFPCFLGMFTMGRVVGSSNRKRKRQLQLQWQQAMASRGSIQIVGTSISESRVVRKQAVERVVMAVMDLRSPGAASLSPGTNPTQKAVIAAGAHRCQLLSFKSSGPRETKARAVKSSPKFLRAV